MQPSFPAWLHSAAFYQVYPQSFADSNGDGIGDLPGLISKLPYLKELGITAIWLNPFFESPFLDAGYDVADFRKVAPRYGTNEDAVRLFAEAHRLGLKVVLDLVAGHTSDRHPWFKAASADSESPYRQHYIFTGAVPEKPLFGDTVPKTAQGEYYVANFFSFQPALNYGYSDPDPLHPWERSPNHPHCLATRAELRDIMRYWLELGCDGFRVDMAASLIKGAVNSAALKELWQSIRSWLEREFPDAVLIAEWGNPEDAINAGYHVDFLLHFGEPAYVHLVGPLNEVREAGRSPPVFFDRAGHGDIRLFLTNYLHHYHATLGRGFIALPTGNHDFPRPRLGRTPAELRVLYAMLLTMPGVPFIYYGDEIGMRNISGLPEKEGSMWRTGNRTPMQWTDGAPNFGFSTAHPDQLYLPVDPTLDAPTVEAQTGDAGSLLEFTRDLLALRQTHRALGNTGSFAPLYAEAGARPFVYSRTADNRRFVVALHPAGVPGEVDLPDFSGATLLRSEGARLTGTKLSLDPVSFALLELL